MPKYRLIRPAFISPRPGQPSQLLPAGAEIEYAGIPGSALEPLDAEAQAAVLARKEAPKGVLPLDGQRPKVEPRPDPATVEIPEGWMDLRPEQIVNLSRRLGAPRNNKYAQAIRWIENELKRRTPQETSENDDGNG